VKRFYLRLLVKSMISPGSLCGGELSPEKGTHGAKCYSEKKKKNLFYVGVPAEIRSKPKKID